MNRIRLLAFVCLIFIGTLTSCNVFGAGTTEETAPADVPVADTAVGNTAVSGADQPLVGQGILVCTPACSDRAQCGFLNDQDPVILVSRTEPRTAGHDAFAAQGTIADILEMQSVTLQNNATAEQFQAPFYRIRTADIESGWVAGWCIQQ